MPSQLIISGETGGTPPYSFYVCNENMNYCVLLGNIGGTYTLNEFFSGAQTLIIKLIDSTGCLIFKTVFCPEDTVFILTENGLIITTESGDYLEWL